MRFLIPLAVPLILGAAQDTAWKSFASPKGGFSVLLPGEPAEQSRKVKTHAGVVEVTLYVVDVPKAGNYVVGYTEFPEKGLQAGTSEKRLDNARDGAVRSARGKLQSETKIVLGSFPGRELIIEGDGKDLVRTRIYAVKSRLYQTMVVGSKTTVDGREALRFLDSFKLTSEQRSEPRP
jgi:hypothetical protein